MTDSPQIRVLCVDDHPLLSAGLSTVINDEGDMVVVAHALTGADALLKLREHRPDVTLLDIRLPDISGIDLLVAIRKEFPEARVVMVTTASGDIEIHRALQAGARGYLLKSMSPGSLIEAIRQVHAGKKYVPAEVAAHITEHMGEAELTVRETEVLGLLAGGNRNRDIGDKLFISEETVKVHIRHIMEKLGARDRTEAIAIAVRRGIMQL